MSLALLHMRSWLDIGSMCCYAEVCANRSLVYTVHNGSDLKTWMAKKYGGMDFVVRGMILYCAE